jgi:hypothetical protein
MKKFLILLLLATPAQGKNISQPEPEPEPEQSQPEPSSPKEDSQDFRCFAEIRKNESRVFSCHNKPTPITNQNYPDEKWKRP